jgi:hypothetical protein
MPVILAKKVLEKYPARAQQGLILYDTFLRVYPTTLTICPSPKIPPIAKVGASYALGYINFKNHLRRRGDSSCALTTSTICSDALLIQPN